MMKTLRNRREFIGLGLLGATVGACSIPHHRTKSSPISSKIRADILAFLGPQGGPLPPIIEADLDIAHVTAARPDLRTTDQTVEAIQRMVAAVQGNPRLSLARTAHDVDRITARQSKQIAVILGLQHLPENANMARLAQEGVRISTLAYASSNHYAGGWKDDTGLTADGERIIREGFLPNSVAIDLSHTNPIVARAVVKLLAGMKKSHAVLDSHTACADLYDHPRSMPDDVLRGIADAGGIVGIPGITFMLGSDPKDKSMAPYVAHIQHALGASGEDSVAIGSDTVYIHQDPAASEAQFKKMQDTFDRDRLLRSRFPAEIPELNRGDKMIVIAKALSDARVPERVIDKVIGGNAHRFIHEAF